MLFDFLSNTNSFTTSKNETCCIKNLTKSLHRWDCEIFCTVNNTPAQPFNQYTGNTAQLPFTDCASVNAELDVYKGTERCIFVGTESVKVDQETARVTACVDLFGASASLLSLPESEPEVWDYVLTFLRS